MTIIAVKKEKKKITISSDSQITAGQMIEFTNKLCKVGNIVFWGAGYLNELQIMERFLKDNGYDEKTVKNEQALFNLFGDFYKYLKDKGVIDSRENWEKSVFNSFIFIIENLGKVYKYSHWCLMEVKDYTAVGSGQAIGKTVLSMGGTTQEAVKKASDLTIYCWGDVNTIEVKI